MPETRFSVFHKLSVLALLTAALTFTACGGGGGGGGGGGDTASLQPGMTSFSGFPGVDPADLPPGATGIPPWFTNETLWVRFSGNVGLEGAQTPGFFSTLPGGTPQTFLGLTTGAPAAISNADSTGIEYFAFADQTAANAAFRVLRDMDGVAHLGIVGVAKNDPRYLVFDPVVPLGNLFGLPFKAAFDANTQYDVFIPSAAQSPFHLTVNGQGVAQFGSLPPVTVPAFSGTPATSSLFITAAGSAPNNIPPQIVEVSTLEIDAGNATPGAIPFDDVIRLSFQPAIDPGTINPLKNVLVRNLDVQTTTSPNGVIVPVVVTSDPTNTTFFLTPASSAGFGAGPFDIRVEIGTNADAVDNILGVPSGIDGNQLPLANFQVVTFTTVFEPGVATPASIGETFETNDQEDENFMARFNAALWNQDGNRRLMGLPISGSAVPNGGGLGDMALGAPRVQFPMTPSGVGTVGNPNPIIPFSAPFDDDQTNGCFNNVISGTAPNMCGTIVNPDGGNHLQLMYTTTQAGQSTNANLPGGLADAVELFEWGALSGVATGFTFDGFRMRMGHTVCDGPPLGNMPTQGMTVQFDENFNFDNPQNEWILPAAHPFPLNNDPGESPITVYGPAPYVLGEFTLAAQFIPYPLLTLPFDFDFNRTEPNTSNQQRNPNILVDINTPATPANPIPPTSNLVLGTNVNSPVPGRRITGGPGTATAFFLDAVVYHGRFTFVKKSSSARTAFYDLGAIGTPDYTSLTLTPTIAQQPVGTNTTVKIQGASDNGFGAPDPNAQTVLVTYVTRNGMVNSNLLNLLDGRRFFRVQFEFEANTLNNTVPSLNGFLLGYQFNP